MRYYYSFYWIEKVESQNDEFNNIKLSLTDFRLKKDIQALFTNNSLVINETSYPIIGKIRRDDIDALSTILVGGVPMIESSHQQQNEEEIMTPVETVLVSVLERCTTELLPLEFGDMLFVKRESEEP